MTEVNCPFHAHPVLIHTGKELVLLHGMAKGCYAAMSFTTVQILFSGLPCQITRLSTSSAAIGAPARARPERRVRPTPRLLTGPTPGSRSRPRSRSRTSPVRYFPISAGPLSRTGLHNPSGSASGQDGLREPPHPTSSDTGSGVGIGPSVRPPGKPPPRRGFPSRPHPNRPSGPPRSRSGPLSDERARRRRYLENGLRRDARTESQCWDQTCKGAARDGASEDSPTPYSSRSDSQTQTPPGAPCRGHEDRSVHAGRAPGPEHSPAPAETRLGDSRRDEGKRNPAAGGIDRAGLVRTQPGTGPRGPGRRLHQTHRGTPIPLWRRANSPRRRAERAT